MNITFEKYKYIPYFPPFFSLKYLQYLFISHSLHFGLLAIHLSLPCNIK